MFTWQRQARSRHKKEVPAEIYISIVDSLYGDSRSLFMGAVALSLTVLFTAWKASEPLLYLCALAVAVVSVIRALGVRAYQRHRSRMTTADEASRWEFRYAIGTSAYVALLGTWCVLAFAVTSDPFVQLVSMASTIANLIGVTGRNFGSSRLVAVQILCAAPLMTVALLISGDVYYAVYALLFMTFFVSMKFISDRLRQTLTDAVVAARDNTLLASRFDAALNNMSLGLCMFDSGMHLTVVNRRCMELLGVSDNVVQRGLSVAELLREASSAGKLPEAYVGRLATEIEAHFSGAAGEDIEVETVGGRTLAFSFQPMADRGSVVLIEDITERKAAAAKIHHLARYDALTDLPNRTFFRDQMELALARVRRSLESCAVLFIDLDQFKQINDTMGHPFGDALLCAVADRLRGIARDSDLVARFGGDEFVILQYPVKRPEDAASLARRVVEALAEPLEIERHQLVIGASVGIAVAPQDGMDADLLLKNADMALYRTKSEGRGAWRFFEREMDVKAQARRSLEIDLRNAVAGNAFKLHYQPLINLKTRQVTTCEALLRWPHPDRGMVSPAEFIPIAEEMGLIVEIGDWVLTQACLECMAWPEDIRVAVNLSPIQFRRGNVTEAVGRALAKSGLPANRLEIEITESVLVQDTDATRACLMQLREMGVRISLDDFGTGYSSLSYLHSFPLHKVKIDRSFLQGITSSERSLTLLRGVARLSAELGMSVVVEGVETDEELSLVAREARVDEAQGYLFSPPIPGPLIRDLLAVSQAPKKAKATLRAVPTPLTSAGA
jgi:diguanylate cyclase (GGDEF)-like protein